MVRNIGYLQNRTRSVNHQYAEVQSASLSSCSRRIAWNNRCEGKDNASDMITHYSRLESSLTFTVQRVRKGSSLMSCPLDRRREVGGGWLPAVRCTTHVQTFKVCLETNEIGIEAIDHEGDIV